MIINYHTIKRKCILYFLFYYLMIDKITQDILDKIIIELNKEENMYKLKKK